MANIRVRYDVTMSIDMEVPDEVLKTIQSPYETKGTEKEDSRQRALRVLENKASQMLSAVSDNLPTINLQIYELIDVEDSDNENMIWEY